MSEDYAVRVQAMDYLFLCRLKAALEYQANMIVDGEDAPDGISPDGVVDYMLVLLAEALADKWREENL